MKHVKYCWCSIIVWGVPYYDGMNASNWFIVVLDKLNGITPCLLHFITNEKQICTAQSHTNTNSYMHEAACFTCNILGGMFCNS